MHVYVYIYVLRNLWGSGLGVRKTFHILKSSLHFYFIFSIYVYSFFFFFTLYHRISSNLSPWYSLILPQNINKRFLTNNIRTVTQLYLWGSVNWGIPSYFNWKKKNVNWYKLSRTPRSYKLNYVEQSSGCCTTGIKVTLYVNYTAIKKLLIHLKFNTVYKVQVNFLWTGKYLVVLN